MLNSVLRMLKVLCPKVDMFGKWVPSENRKLLAGGQLFLMFQASHSDPELSEFWGLEDRKLYVHVSDMSFSPYMPTFMVMEEVPEEDWASVGAGVNELPLTA